MKNVAKARVLVTRFPYKSQLGGEEMHTISLMRGFDKKGVEAFFMGSDGILLDLFGKNGFSVKKAWLGKPPVTKAGLLVFTILSPVLFVLAGWHLWKARKRWQVNVLYCLSFGEKLLMTPWARIFGMKILWLEHARIGKWLARNPWRHVYKFLSGWVTVVVTSNAMRPEIEGFAKNVEAISCGVIVDKGVALRDNVQKFLNSGFAVGTVARLTVDKGVDMIAKLVHCKPDMRLIIVGDGPLRTAIEKMGNSGQIMVLDSMPRGELMSLYKALDLFILGSTEMDPFGMVAAEAMWFGTPVLITDKCGFSEDLHNGKEAFVVEAKFAALDKAVKKLMKHEGVRKGAGRRGQDFVRKNYKLKDMVDRFRRLL
jgi:glycosyltransferase involved in cell wall biosynthesis